MQSYLVLLIIVIYFSILLTISYFVSKKHTDNDAFFLANRKSPWWLIAIGMIGTSISGVTFVSVPGMVRDINFSYMQTVFGFFFGYLIIAYVLLPLYYKLNLTTIYTYLEERFGRKSYKTGASFFLLSKIIGASARLYIVAIILQKVVFDSWNVPFYLTVFITVLLIWFYTRKSGIKTVIWTDTIQTLVLISALGLILYEVARNLQINFSDLISNLHQSPNTDIFVFNDWHSKQNFWKQFLSGVFIPIVMTGLDQDMMQKNLTCKTLKDAQKNMTWYGLAFIPINFLFLTLGAMLLMLATQNGIQLPTESDNILTVFASQYLGNTVLVLFIVGMIAAAFSSADSALTSITTSFSVDILGVKSLSENEGVKLRKRIHILTALLFVIFVILFKEINNESIIDTIYTIVGYTYGPLLGMYAYGLFTKRNVNDKIVPYICIIAPVLCYLLNIYSKAHWNYSFGYELLMINGALTFAGLWISKKSEP
ncbi:Na+/solute symporter [uncultured Paludibacter sp.]|nr:Na+/solute symporter [uncultured Paludibacter sp.]